MATFMADRLRHWSEQEKNNKNIRKIKMKNKLSFEYLTKRTKNTEYTLFDSESVQSFKEYCFCLSCRIKVVSVFDGFIVFKTKSLLVYKVFNYKGELVEKSSYFQYLKNKGKNK
jgi:hypothetical protein